MVRPGGQRTPLDARNEEDTQTLTLGKEFQAAECLMNAEVEFLLKNARERKLEDDPDAEQSLPPVFVKTHTYVQKFSRFKNAATIDQLKEALSKKSFGEGDPPKRLQSFEIAQLGNLSPETVEEAKVVIPSLEWVRDEELQEVLNDVANFQRFQS